MSSSRHTQAGLEPEIRDAVLQLVLERGLERRDEAFQLSSGEWSHDYVDAKRVLSRGTDLVLVSRAVIAVAATLPAVFDAAGGPTMGADALAHGVSVLSGCDWFTVRKDRKGHGKQKLIEGSEVEDRSVMLLDDVVTTGGSTLRAFETVEALGARVTLAVCLVARSGRAWERLEERGVPFVPLLTWRELGIEPVGS